MFLATTNKLNPTSTMKQLSKLQSTLFLIGGVLMVIGAGCYAFIYAQQVVCWVYLAGALLIASMQVSETYEGDNQAVKRLKRIMTFADIFFVLSGLLMVDSAYMFMRDSFTDIVSYYNLVYNKWVLLLLVAAILEMYTMHRISAELKKEEKNQNEN